MAEIKWIKSYKQEKKKSYVAKIRINTVVNSASQEKMLSLRAEAEAAISQELANELIDAYASDYKVRVKYKYLGLTD